MKRQGPKVSGNVTSHPFQTPERSFAPRHFGSTLQQRLHCPRAELASLHLSHCIPPSDSNAAGWRDASGISQMSFSLLPPAFPGSTMVPPFPVAAMSHAAARLATLTQGPLTEGCCGRAAPCQGHPLHYRLLPGSSDSKRSCQWSQLICTLALFERPSAKPISALRGKQ